MCDFIDECREYVPVCSQIDTDLGRPGCFTAITASQKNTDACGMTQPVGSATLAVKVAEAASDYRLAHRHDEFAKQYSIEQLRDELFNAVIDWERAVDDGQ